MVDLVTPGPNTGFAYFDYPAQVVASNIAIMNARADEMLEMAIETIDALGSVEVPLDSPQPGKFVIPEIKIPSAVSPPQGPIEGDNLFGEVPGFEDADWVDIGAASGVDSSLLLRPGTFESKVGQPDFPAAPGDVTTEGEPTAPATVVTPALPSSPHWIAPSVPSLTQITLPNFVAIVPPTINDVVPVFTGTEPNGIVYTEPEYDSELLDQTRTTILRLFEGGTGIPIIIQQALFDAARGREQQTAQEAEEEAFDAWAGRNFSMPPGMLVAAVTNAVEKSRLAQNTLERDILSKAAVWEIENLRFAVAQGVALETLLIDKFNKMAQRVFEVARAQSEIEVKIYEAAITLYNAQQAARQIEATIYRAKWDGEISKVTAYKVQVDGEVAKGQLNEQLVRIYLGEWEGVKNIVETYNAQLRGAQTIAEIGRIGIEKYGIEVGAWAKKIDVRKIPFETWVERMRGEAVKVSAMEAEVRGFAETVKAQENEANVKIKYIDLKLNSARVSTEKYIGKLQALRDFLHAQLDAINARASTYQADTGRYRAEIEGKNMQLSKDLQVTEMRLQNDIAYYGTQLREFDAVLNRQIERGKIIVEALSSAGRISSSLAAGAMSAIHVQSAIGGSSSVGQSNQYARHINQSGNANYNWDNLAPPIEPPPPIP